MTHVTQQRGSWWILALVVTLAACADGAARSSASTSKVTSETSSSAAVESVSLVQLLSAPRNYAGKRVRVQGSLRCGNEERALYLSNHDADYFNFGASVWLSPEACRDEEEDGVVTIVGTFDLSRDVAPWTSEIRAIERIDRVRSRAQYPQEMIKRPTEPTEEAPGGSQRPR
jgi:hypothetical protein